MDKMKILVVDDEKDICFYIKSMLEKEGYDVSTAFNGTEGLQKATGERPDLILLDIMLPDTNGFEVLHKLRYNAETAHIPIVIVSVKRDTDTIFKSRDFRSVDYISKPFNSQDLLKLVKRYLHIFGSETIHPRIEPKEKIHIKLQTAEAVLYLCSQGERVPAETIERARADLYDASEFLVKAGY